MLLVFGIAFLSHRESQRSALVRITAIWLEPGWSDYPVAQSEVAYYCRQLLFINGGEFARNRQRFTFLGSKPRESRLERSAAELVRFDELFNFPLQPSPVNSPARVISDPQDSTTDGLQVFIFTCTTPELKRRLDLRKRYPAFKIFWPLPYEILDIAEFDPSFGGDLKMAQRHRVAPN
jgi:hypothetical protein